MKDVHITLRVDNKCAGEAARLAKDRIPPNRKHVDLIQEISKINANSPITVNFEHVYGHQDDFVAFNDLPREAQLNVICYQEAKDFLRCIIASNDPPLPWIPDAKWGCWIGEQMITGEVGHKVCAAIHG